MVGQIYHPENGVVHKISSHTTLEQSEKPRKYQVYINEMSYYIYINVFISM